MISGIFIIFVNCNRDVDNTTSKNGSYKSVDVGNTFREQFSKMKNSIKKSAERVEDNMSNKLNEEISEIRREIKKKERDDKEARKRRKREREKGKEIHEVRSTLRLEKRKLTQDNWVTQIRDFDLYYKGAKFKNEDILLTRVNDKFQNGLIRFVIEYQSIGLSAIQKEDFFERIVMRSNDLQLSAIDNEGKALLHYLIETGNFTLLDILLKHKIYILRQYFNSEKDGFVGRDDSYDMLYNNDNYKDNDRSSIKMKLIPECIISEYKKKYLSVKRIGTETAKANAYNNNLMITKIYTHIHGLLINYFGTKESEIHNMKYLIKQSNVSIPKPLKTIFGRR